MAPKRKLPDAEEEAQTISESVEYTKDGKDALVTVTVTIEAYREYRSLKRIEADVYYQTTNAKRTQRKTSAGYLIAWIVDKSIKNADGKGDATGELRTSLKEVYTKAGAVRAVARDHVELLGSDSLVFIDGFTLEARFRGVGVAQQAMRGFHNLVPRLLPSGKQANGATAILSPARSEGTKIKNGKSDVEIERALVASYTRSGYAVLIQGDEDVLGSVTVMGRAVEGIQADEEEDPYGGAARPQKRVKKTKKKLAS